MSANDALYLKVKLMHHKRQYDSDGDQSRYFVNCVSTAASVWISEQNAMRARRSIPLLAAQGALTVGSPALAAAMDTLAEVLFCPVDQSHSATDFINHFAENVQSRYNSELRPVRDALKSLGLLA